MSCELKMNDQVYINEMMKSFIRISKDIQRKTDQHLENIESTQRIVIEKVAGIRSLNDLNFKEILKNRDEILQNRKIIVENKEEFLENFELLGSKVDKILEKLELLPIS